MPTVDIGNITAQEAVDNIRSKLAIPSRRWTDYMGEVNAKVFTVAGATKLGLVKDLQAAIVKAAEQGTTITEFRKDFDNIVSRYGWSYKGNRGWRTGIIFNTNLRTAHAAGRWKQIQRVKSVRPYLIYSTVDDSEVREEHRRWHYIALPVDDPTWDWLYPPNDYGCRCFVISANEKLLQKLGIEPSPTLQPKITERINTRTGEILGEAPEGVGVGWNYNVGKAWLGADIALGKHIAHLDNKMLTAVQPVLNEYSDFLDKSWRAWLKQTDVKPKGYAHTVGFLPPSIIKLLRDDFSPADSAAIVIFDNQTSHLRGGHKKQGARFPEHWLRDLPKRLRNYQAIVKHKNDYLFVLKGTTEDNKQGRAVVAVNFKRKGKTFNSVRSLGVMDVRHLKQKDYELIEGKI